MLRHGETLSSAMCAPRLSGVDFRPRPAGCQRWPGGMKRCLPRLVITGQFKCGTTAMFDTLAQHPDLLLPRKLEGGEWHERCPLNKESCVIKEARMPLLTPRPLLTTAWGGRRQCWSEAAQLFKAPSASGERLHATRRSDALDGAPAAHALRPGPNAQPGSPTHDGPTGAAASDAGKCGVLCSWIAWVSGSGLRRLPSAAQTEDDTRPVLEASPYYLSGMVDALEDLQRFVRYVPDVKLIVMVRASRSAANAAPSWLRLEWFPCRCATRWTAPSASSSCSASRRSGRAPRAVSWATILLSRHGSPAVPLRRCRRLLLSEAWWWAQDVVEEEMRVQGLQLFTDPAMKSACLMESTKWQQIPTFNGRTGFKGRILRWGGARPPPRLRRGCVCSCGAA